MLKVVPSLAAPGMVLALPVLHPQRPGHLLLKPGATLDSATIARLVEFRIPCLWIRYPPLDYLVRYASPRIMIEHARLTAVLADSFDSIARSSRAEIDFPAYAAAVRGLIDQLISAPDAALFIHEMVDAGYPLLAHSSNVCFLSLLMGLKLDGYLVDQRAGIAPRRAKRIESLAVGAMLCDVGMLRLDQEVVDRWFAVGDERDPRWREHVLVGFNLVRGQIAPTAAAAVLHHHQRIDGSGFPRRARAFGPPAALAGKQIHIFARIVAVADLFNRLRHPPGPPETRSTVPNVCALRAVLEEVQRHTLDPVVFRALLDVAPPYAPGTPVTLSDGTNAVVTDWSQADPCSPTVTPIEQLDPDRRTPPVLGEPIDLRARPELSVIAADGQDVSRDNFHPAPASGTIKPPAADPFTADDLPDAARRHPAA